MAVATKRPDPANATYWWRAIVRLEAAREGRVSISLAASGFLGISFKHTRERAMHSAKYLAPRDSLFLTRLVQ